jgi:fucose permease
MPYLKQILQLSPFEASLILFSFYITVTFTALPSATIIRKVGYKNGMALGMATMMIAGFLFIHTPKVDITQSHGLFKTNILPTLSLVLAQRFFMVKYNCLIHP